MTPPPVVVVGASAGGVSALFELTAALPPHFPAVMGVVLHVGNRPSILPALINRRSTNPAVHPREGEVPVPGKIYIAPPDQHMLLHPQGIQLSRGPRENHARPAIDPLFRAAALHWRSRAIGVVLTGNLDDGTAGLAAIKECGGTAIVQDPATAAEPSMPASAIANVQVDHCLPLEQIPSVLNLLVNQMPARAAEGQPPERLLREQAASEGGDADRAPLLEAMGTRSKLTCPECGGVLWEINGAKPLRYRCHTGHGYSAGSLDVAHAEVLDQSLASSYRLLREREILLRRLATVAEATGDTHQAEVGRRAATQVAEQAQQLYQLMTTGGSSA